MSSEEALVNWALKHLLFIHASGTNLFLKEKDIKTSAYLKNTGPVGCSAAAQ